MLGNWYKPVTGLGLYSKELITIDEPDEPGNVGLMMSFDLKSTFCGSGNFWESMSILCGGNDHGDNNPNRETRGVLAMLIEDWSEVPIMLDLDDTDEFFVELDMLYLRDLILLDPAERWDDTPDWVFTKVTK